MFLQPYKADQRAGACGGGVGFPHGELSNCQEQKQLGQSPEMKIIEETVQGPSIHFCLCFFLSPAFLCGKSRARMIHRAAGKGSIAGARPLARYGEGEQGGKRWLFEASNSLAGGLSSWQVA